MKPLSIKSRIILPFVIIVILILGIAHLLFFQYVQSYDNNKDIVYQQKSLVPSSVFFVISSLIIAGIGIILFWILLGKVQKKIDKINKELLKKIRELEIAHNKANEAEQRAEKAIRMKNDFLANINHELRTPLNGILGMTGLVLDTDLDENQEAFLNMIVESGDHLFRIISDLLDFSQIETGNLIFESALFNLTTLIKNTISVLKPSADIKNISLEYSITPKVINYYGDRVRLGQILINLITNSIKYSEKGIVKISVVLEEKLEISVEDTGVGIPEDKIDTIFDCFYQIENTYTKTHEGVGLGLSIVKELVQLLDGEISIKSKPGVGTAFRVSLPVENTPTDAKIIPEFSSSDKKYKLKGLRVLIAEDEAVNRIYLNKIITKQGADVTEAVNGQEVLDKYETGRFDLILMDMGMPLIDGIEATVRIREAERFSENYVYIIALTANAFPEDVKKCVDAGMDHFLSKPVKENDLLSVIDETMSK